MSPPGLASITLAGDVAAALASVPAAAGVGMIVAAFGRPLVVGVASNLRRWAAAHLGRGEKPAAGRRPKTDLTAVAAEIAWSPADGPFRQRLVYERLMAPLVPLAERRDLKRPAFLQLDPGQRFPRVSIVSGETERAHRYGPFRDRRAAEKARDVLHRVFPLRPCEHVFEPDPALPLGVACLFAQVRSCAAPCLARVGEDEYRALAARAAAWLAEPEAREAVDAAFPSLITRAAEARGLVLDPGRNTIGLFPVRDGRVLDQAAVVAPFADLEAAVRALEWPEGETADDWPWLLAFLRGRGRRGSLLLVREHEDRKALLERVRAGLPQRFGGNLVARSEQRRSTEQ